MKWRGGRIRDEERGLEGLEKEVKGNGTYKDT